MFLASVSLGVALPAVACDRVEANSVTIRVVARFVDESIKDVAPKTAGSAGVLTKGDTVTGTSILRNAVPQFDKPQGARVGTDRYVFTGLSSQNVRGDIVATFPGGTVHARGVYVRGPGAKLSIVGGTGFYAGATGVMEGQALANGASLNIYRLRVP